MASLQLGREGEEEGGGGVARARIAQLEERLEEAQEKYRETENQVQARKVHIFILTVTPLRSPFLSFRSPHSPLLPLI